MRFARAIWGCDQQLQTSSGFALAQWLGCQDWTKFYLCRKAVFLVISETKNQLVELILVVQPNPSSPELENSFLSLARGVPAKHHVNGGKSAHNMRNMWNGTHVKGGCPLEKDLLLFATPSIFSWIYNNLQVWASENLGTFGPSMSIYRDGKSHNLILFQLKMLPQEAATKAGHNATASVSICEPPQPLIDNWSKSKV